MTKDWVTKLTWKLRIVNIIFALGLIVYLEVYPLAIPVVIIWIPATISKYLRDKEKKTNELTQTNQSASIA